MAKRKMSKRKRVYYIILRRIVKQYRKTITYKIFRSKKRAILKKYPRGSKARRKAYINLLLRVIKTHAFKRYFAKMNKLHKKFPYNRKKWLKMKRKILVLYKIAALRKKKAKIRKKVKKKVKKARKKKPRKKPTKKRRRPKKKLEWWEAWGFPAITLPEWKVPKLKGYEDDLMGEYEDLGKKKKKKGFWKRLKKKLRRKKKRRRRKKKRTLMSRFKLRKHIGPGKWRKKKSFFTKTGAQKWGVEYALKHPGMQTRVKKRKGIKLKRWKVQARWPMYPFPPT